MCEAQAYDLSWPLTPYQLENISDMHRKTIADVGAAEVRLTALENVKPFATVLKRADETVNNSGAQQDDDELQFLAEANSVYFIETFLLHTSVTADFLFNWGVPSGVAYYAPSWIGSVAYWDSLSLVGTPASLFTSAGGGMAIAGGNTSICGFRFMTIVILGGSGGYIKLQWTQNAAVASNNVIKAGSFLRYQKIG